MSYKYCMSCGGSNQADAKFCQKCGNSFDGSVKPATASKPKRQSTDPDDESGDATEVPDIDSVEFEFEVASHDTFHIGRALKTIHDSLKKADGEGVEK